MSACCGYSIHIRHDHIHKYHVWQDFCTELDGSSAAFGFAHQFKIIVNHQESCQAAAHHGVIVNQHDTNGLGRRVCHSVSFCGSFIHCKMSSVPMTGLARDS